MLAWLPPPPDDFSRRCRVLAASDGGSLTGYALRTLATHALDSNKLAALARVVTSLQDSGGTHAPLQPVRLGLLSNSTTALVEMALVATAPRHGLLLDIVTGNYSQVVQDAFDAQSAFNRSRPDIVLFALTPAALDLRAPPGDDKNAVAAIERALNLVDALRSGVRMAGAGTCLVQTLPPPAEALFGTIDRQLPGAPGQLAEAFNRGLGERLSGSGDVALDIAQLAQQVGLERWHDPVQWHLAKLPFAQELVPLWADHVCRAIAALRGLSRRCLVLDLDNTLWGGVIGDDGLSGIVLGPGEPVGEAYLEVQRTALALRDRGVVLAVSSKNDDAIARSPFREHPEMLLREEHIAVFQADWNDKAANISAIADALSLGLQSLVLLDDNPAERARVREALPDVAVPELPDDPALYARTLLSAGYFDTTTFSSEDVARARFYRDDARRVALQRGVGDVGEWLASLDMTIVFGRFDAISRPRVAQLVAKSNQFNLTTRRYSQSEIERLEADPSAYTLQVRLRDRFGDNGIISVAICRDRGESWEIDTWLMSCRVLGRRVQEAVLADLAKHARAAGARRLLGRYIPTSRNGLVRDHYRQLGFAHAGGAEGEETLWSLELLDYTVSELPFRVEYNDVAVVSV